MALNREESILLRLAEECCETGQRVSKALLFDLEEVQPGQSKTNADRLVEELHDIISVAFMAYREGLISYPMPSEETILAKHAKVEKYLAYQRSIGRLRED